MDALHENTEKFSDTYKLFAVSLVCPCDTGGCESCYIEGLLSYRIMQIVLCPAFVVDYSASLVADVLADPVVENEQPVRCTNLTMDCLRMLLATSANHLRNLLGQ